MIKRTRKKKYSLLTNTYTINPFKSEAQRRWMYANDPEMAKEWQEHTPKGANLPEKVKKRTKNAKQAVGNKSKDKKLIVPMGLALHQLQQNEVQKRIGKIAESLMGMSEGHTRNTVGNFTAAGLVLKDSPLAMPGYGQIYYNDKTKEAWYVGGDGDERGFDKYVKQILLELPNVKSVRYESEYSPKEPGWKKVYDPSTHNAFCATGQGGGIDSSCSSSESHTVTWEHRKSKLLDMPTSRLAKIVAKHADRKEDHEEYAKLGRKTLLSLIELHEKNSYSKREMSKTEYEKASHNSLLGRMFGGGGANCGTGAGGFQPGNTCAKGDAGGSTSTGGGKEGTSKDGSEREPKEAVRDHTSTPEFKAWFGESKVVDQNGDPKENASIDGIRTQGNKPVVVYHGTPGGEFHEFRKDKIANPDQLHFGPGFYFTEDVKAAEEFARGGHSTQATGTTPTVMKFYLKSEKPFDIDKDEIDPSKLHPSEAKNVRAALVQKAYLDGGRDEAMDVGRRFDRGEVKMKYRELADAAGVGGLGVSKTRIQEHLQSLGHDSITTQAPDVGEKGKNRYWIVFEPTQIKSTSNKGTFNPKDPNVLNVFCPTGSGGGVDATCSSSKGANVDTAKIVESLVGKSVEIARSILASHVMQKLGKSGEWLKDKTLKVLVKLEKRYGKVGAAAIFSSGQAISWGVFLGSTHLVGFPVYLPSAVGMAPAAAIAETVKALKAGKTKATHNAEELSEEDLLRLGHALVAHISHIWANRPEKYRHPTENVFCPTGQGGGVDATCSPSHSESLLESLKTSGGFTYQPVDDTTPKEGFAVAAFPGAEKVLDLNRITPSDIFDYLTEHAEKFEDPRVHVGGWTDNGKVYLDLSMVVKDKNEAINLGIKHNQLAVFDLGKMETITVPSKRTKEATHNVKEEAYTRIKSPVGLNPRVSNAGRTQYVQEDYGERADGTGDEGTA